MMPAAGFDDDVAVLIYRHPPDPLNVQAAATDPSCLAAIRSRLRHWLSQAGIGARDGADILIAIGEAGANAVEHATAGRAGGREADGREPVQIAVTVRVANAAVEVTVADTGTWRPPRDRPGTRGHGIVFMRALMNEITISMSERGTTVTMTKEL